MASVPPAPTGSKHHLNLWTASGRERADKEKNIMSVSRKLCWTTNITSGRKQQMTKEISNTNSSLWGQEFVPVPQHKQNDTDLPAGDLPHSWAWWQDRRKSGLKQNNEIEEPLWSATMNFCNSNDLYHRRKLAPLTFDCSDDPKSLLRLMHFALEALNNEIFWHLLTFSVSSFQPPFKCPPLQNKLLGLLSDLKNNRDDNRPKSRPIQNLEQFILDYYSMGACTVTPAPSSHDLMRPTSNSVPEQPVAQESLISGWTAGSPDESNTKTQQPHDAFFMNRREPITSLWKIWVATI